LKIKGEKSGKGFFSGRGTSSRPLFFHQRILTMSITADDVMANLRAMLADPAQLPATKPKLAEDTQPTVPDAVFQPNVEIPDIADIVCVADAPTIDEPECETVSPVFKGLDCLAVVLDDGATFSGLEGCRICQVDGDDVSEESYAAGISISDLLTLRDALLTIRHILAK